MRKKQEEKEEDAIQQLQKQLDEMRKAKEQAKTVTITQEQPQKREKEEIIPEILLHPHIHHKDKPEKLQDYSMWKKQGGFIRRWFRKKKYQLNMDRAILINMELNIGDHINFIAYENDGGFVYKKRKYLFDFKSMYYNQSQKLWCYDYHENFCLPIKRQIPMKEMRAEIEEDIGDEAREGYAQVEYLTNPKTLYEYSIAKLAEGILRGAALEQWLKRIFFVGIISILGLLVIGILMFVKFRGIEKALTVIGVEGG